MLSFAKNHLDTHQALYLYDLKLISNPIKFIYLHFILEEEHPDS